GHWSTSRFRYAFVFLVLLSLILTAVSLLYTAHVARDSVARDALISANRAAIRHHFQRDAQLRAALCHVLPALSKDAVAPARPDFAQLSREL
ncbi:hypothetical protein, partial [Bacillus cereus group sp. BC327]|uniref:hypothetical protein n=1 Tax=Bacillus cereus group sp. BC327 TaxID=3445309 RepID=UPI003F234756